MKHGYTTLLRRQGDDHGYLGCRPSHLHRLRGKMINDKRRIVISPIEERNKKTHPQLANNTIDFIKTTHGMDLLNDPL